jgi:hypothetical protein
MAESSGNRGPSPQFPLTAAVSSTGTSAPTTTTVTAPVASKKRSMYDDLEEMMYGFGTEVW